MLRVKLTRYKSILMMEVIEQDENLRGSGLIFQDNDFRIYSYDSPEISFLENALMIRGRDNTEDLKISVRIFDTEGEAIDYMRQCVRAVKKYNESFETNENSQVEEVIAE